MKRFRWLKDGTRRSALSDEIHGDLVGARALIDYSVAQIGEGGEAVHIIGAAVAVHVLIGDRIIIKDVGGTEPAVEEGLVGVTSEEIAAGPGLSRAVVALAHDQNSFLLEIHTVDVNLFRERDALPDVPRIEDDFVSTSLCEAGVMGLPAFARGNIT